MLLNNQQITVCMTDAIKIQLCWKLEMMQRNGKIPCVHELGELISLKCPYYSKQPTDSMQSLSKHHDIFFSFFTELILKCVWATKNPEEPEQT